jgi:molybdopterin-guanine dinucleotide biosynthesis protein A
MIADCTAIILAGGDSRRMGQDKALMLLDGKTLLEQVTVKMQSIFPKVMVSVRRLREGIDTPQVCDEVEESGPLAGIIAGLRQVDTPWIFAVACDMPFVSESVIIHLASLRVSYQAVVPVVQEHSQPMAAFYATNTLEVMRESFATGDKSLRGILKKIKVRYVSELELLENDPLLRSFFDLDTPQDFEQIALMKEPK